MRGVVVCSDDDVDGRALLSEVPKDDELFVRLWSMHEVLGLVAELGAAATSRCRGERLAEAGDRLARRQLNADATGQWTNSSQGGSKCRVRPDLAAVDGNAVLEHPEDLGGRGEVVAQVRVPHGRAYLASSSNVSR